MVGSHVGLRDGSLIELGAQAEQGPTQVGAHRAWVDPQRLSGLLCREVEQHTQRHHLALTFGKATNGIEQCRVDGIRERRHIRSGKNATPTS